MALEICATLLDTPEARNYLDKLANAKGPLYLKDGVIKEANCLLGGASLGLLPAKKRAEYRAAMDRIATAMNQVYGQCPSLEGLQCINGANLAIIKQTAQEANQQQMDSFMQSVRQEFGDFAQQHVTELKESIQYKHGLPISKEYQDQIRAGIHHTKELALDGLTELYKKDLSADHMFTRIKQIPHYDAMLKKSFGLGNDFTVKVHTSQVLAQFEDQKGHYNLPRLQQSMRQTPGFENFNAERFMKVVLLFHDIGKGEAYSERRPFDQHAFTLPIMKEAMIHIGFSEQEVRLATNLVDHDLLGEWQVGKRHDVREVLSAMRALAQDSGVKPRDFLAMQKLFYISDASSYEGIRTSYMERSPVGKLRFAKNNRTAELLHTFSVEHGRVDEETIQLLLLPASLVTGGGAHPLEVFRQDFSGKGYNVYDVSRSILDNRAKLQTVVDSLPDALKPLGKARLDEALEMATCAMTMNADRWTPAHTQGVIVARMEIRAAGIPELLPDKLSGTSSEDIYFGKFTELPQLRGPNSATDNFYQLVDAKGGSSHLLQDLGQCQMISSWCPTSLAVKGYLYKSRAVSEERYYMATTDQYGKITDKPAECYNYFAHAPSDYWDSLNNEIFNKDANIFKIAKERKMDTLQNSIDSTSLFDTSIRYQIAMQMEMFSNIDFQGNDRKNGQVTIHRVEGIGVLDLYGISTDQVGSRRRGVMKRGAYDSGSIICPVMGAGGSDATVQVIPYHRIVNSFLLGAQSSGQGGMSDKSILHADAQREVMFMTDGIETTYEGKGNDLATEFMNR